MPSGVSGIAEPHSEVSLTDFQGPRVAGAFVVLGHRLFGLGHSLSRDRIRRQLQAERGLKKHSHERTVSPNWVAIHLLSPERPEH